MKIKKKIIMIISFLLIIVNINSSILANENKEENAIELKNYQKTISENQNVRIIVELKEKSLVEEAISQNKSFKDLDEDFIKQRKEEIETDQNKFIKDISKYNEDKSSVVNFDTIINGVAVTIKDKNFKEIKNNSNVKDIYYSQEFNRPLLNSSNQIIGSDIAWKDLGYKGENTVVAVIDSGIDVNHKALKITDENSIKLKKENVDSIIKERELKGKYYNSKIPYGYNYYDHSQNLLDSYGVMHGMHVSGIVGANDEENNIYGVAPNTQILAMKVFSDDLNYPTTFTDIWLKALDDAISLGADVVNMSLGSPAGFSRGGSYHPEERNFEKARQAGVVVVVAAGNEGTITDGNLYGEKPLEENFDTAEISNPALSKHSLAVASMENSKKRINTIEFVDGFNKKFTAPISFKSIESSKDKVVGEVLDFNIWDENLEKKDIKDKILLIELPEKKDVNQFTENLLILIKKNPKAILFYSKDNNSTIGATLSLGSEIGKHTIGIIKYETYLDIKASSETVPFSFKININIKPTEVDNENSGKISRFSSWGPTPDLRIKPDITGVGGNIYSTAEKNEYKNMSGTSMASPQVAGAAALMKQHLNTFELQNQNYSDLINLILLNTAKVIDCYDDEYGNRPYLVRQQGAGLLDLEAALKSKVTVTATGTNDDIEDGKLELRQLEDKKFEVILKFMNYSDEKKTYSVYSDAIYEPIKEGRRLQVSKRISSKSNDIIETVNLEPKSEKIIKLELDYTDSDLEFNNFLEGFIMISGNDDILSVPFLGFYGDWTSGKTIDGFNIQEIGKEEKNSQFMVNKEHNVTSSMFVTKHALPLPVIDNTVYFSPSSNYFSEVLARISPLRNMEEIEYSILDFETGETLRVLNSSKEVRKLSRLGFNNSFRIMPDSLWDGKINGVLADSSKEYIYKIKTKLNNNGIGGDGIQEYKFKIMMDTLHPQFNQVEDVKLTDNEGRLKNLKFDVIDKESGIQNVYIQSFNYESKDISINDSLLTPPGEKAPSVKEDSKKIKKQKFGKYLKLEFVDYEELDNKILPKVIDGKLKIEKELISKEPGENTTIPVFLNGHRNKNIQIETPFYADRSHIRISASDYLSNSFNIEMETGFNENYKSLNFMNYGNSITENGVKIYINDKEYNNYLYSSIDDKVKVKFQMKDENKHIKTLGLLKSRTPIYLINNDEIDSNLEQKYKLKIDDLNNTVEFEINPFDTNYQIITLMADGKFPKQEIQQEYKISFGETNKELYKEIRINGKSVDIETNELTVKSGINKFEFVYNRETAKEIFEQISAIKFVGDKFEQQLNKINYFDVDSGKIGYSSSMYSIYIAANIKEDSKLIIEYNNFTEEKDEIIQKENNLEKISIETNDQKILNNLKEKYPVIFITSPELLNVYNDFNTIGGKILVEGFVGNILENDEIKSFSINLLDNQGNIIGEKVEIKKEDLEEKNLEFTKGSKIFYVNKGYQFRVFIEPKDFNLNIQADLETKNGQKATITRRLFFDNINPELEYSIKERKLDAEYVEIEIKSNDNSLLLSLYNNDSLIQKVDKTTISFEDGGVEISEVYRFKLDDGQNKVNISAIDLAKNKTEKNIYIFKTK